MFKLQKIIEKIYQKYPLPKKEVWQNTVNLAKIETNNETFNKVPDQAIACLDIRYLPNDKEKVIKDLKGIIGKKNRLEILLNEPPQYTNENNPYILKLREAIKKLLIKNRK